MELSPVFGLGYVRVRSDQPAEWERVAGTVMGMMVTEEDGRLLLRMDDRVARFVVEPPGTGTSGDGDVVVGWECRSEQAWRTVRDLVEKSGTPVEDVGPSPWAKDAFRCTDPGGLACEFFYGPKVEPVRQFVSPTGVAFVTATQAMGHATVFVNRYREAAEFYERVLGFHLRETIDTEIQAAFLSPNEREHSLALIATPGDTVLNHIMIEVSDLDSVGRAMDRCYDGAAPITLSLGRHWNDHMTSFYFRTPSGFEIEYGFGGRRVDAATWSRLEQGGVGGSSFWGHRIVRPDGSLGRQIGQQDA